MHDRVGYDPRDRFHSRSRPWPTTSSRCRCAPELPARTLQDLVALARGRARRAQLVRLARRAMAHLPRLPARRAAGDGLRLLPRRAAGAARPRGRAHPGRADAARPGAAARPGRARPTRRRDHARATAGCARPAHHRGGRDAGIPHRRPARPVRLARHAGGGARGAVGGSARHPRRARRRGAVPRLRPGGARLDSGAVHGGTGRDTGRTGARWRGSSAPSRLPEAPCSSTAATASPAGTAARACRCPPRW